MSVKTFFEEIADHSVGDNVFSFVEGVVIGLRQSKAGDAVYIMKVRSASRGQGLASETLCRICDAADSNAVTLFLEIEADDGLTAEQLAEWYWRYGFRGSKTEMIREPAR